MGRRSSSASKRLTCFGPRPSYRLICANRSGALSFRRVTTGGCCFGQGPVEDVARLPLLLAPAVLFVRWSAEEDAARLGDVGGEPPTPPPETPPRPNTASDCDVRSGGEAAREVFLEPGLLMLLPPSPPKLLLLLLLLGSFWMGITVLARAASSLVYTS